MLDPYTVNYCLMKGAAMSPSSHPESPENFKMYVALTIGALNVSDCLPGYYDLRTIEFEIYFSRESTKQSIVIIFG
ncbi:hypothetical protein KAS50_07005 [bacterium]|nr:hypothetical protein [bacterium]